MITDQDLINDSSEFKDEPLCTTCGDSLIDQLIEYPSNIPFSKTPIFLHCLCWKCEAFNRIEIQLKYKIDEEGESE